jgi:hypothetical protein
MFAGAFTIRLGNRTLRKQRREMKHLQRKDSVVEEVTEQEVKVALRDLTYWRKLGYLKAIKASWESIVKRATQDPEAVLELRRIVEHHVERMGGPTRKWQPMGYVRIKLANEDTNEEFKGSLGNGNERESKLKDIVMVQTPYSHVNPKHN